MAKAKLVVYDSNLSAFVTAIYNGKARRFIAKKKNKEIIGIEKLIPVSGPFLIEADCPFNYPHPSPTMPYTQKQLLKMINNYEKEGVNILLVENRGICSLRYIHPVRSPIGYYDASNKRIFDLIKSLVVVQEWRYK